MKRHSSYLISAVFLLQILFNHSTCYAVRLPDIFSPSMVLQQERQICLWGFACPDETVYLTGDWLNKTLSCKADRDSMFVFSVPTDKASFEPHTLTIYDSSDTIVLSDILFGEVWFASGQSNMEMPLNGFWNCPVNNNNEVIATSAEWANHIRIVTIPKTGAISPQKEVKGKWQVPSPQTAPWMSATAWYFAQMVSRTLQCPVGVVVCAWGGSRVEGWLPKDTLLNYRDVNLDKEISEGWNGRWWEYYTPMVMYNGMYHPVSRYTCRGFLWYQGEANVGHDADYPERLASMVALWRKEAAGTAETLPFYMTEIAPWAGYGEWLSAPLFREAQHRASKLIPNAGIICTNDLVQPNEVNQIHPAEKQQVGYRLAYMALNKTYGITSIACDAPEYDHHIVKNDTIEIFFRYAEDGLSPWQDIEGFELAGSDGVFYPATAQLNEANKSLLVSSPQVAQPYNVRYCFKAFSIGNVRNHRNLPLVPFRTDE